MSALERAALAESDRMHASVRERYAEIAITEAKTCEQQARTYEAEATRIEREIANLKGREPLAEGIDATR